MTKRSLPVRIALLLMLIAAFWAGYAWATVRAEIKDIVVNNSREELLLYFDLDKAFRKEMEEGIVNGIPASFTFFVSLREVVDGRPGRQVAELEFDHVLSYDSLKDVFDLRFSEDGTSRSVDTLEKAKAMMTEINGVRVVELFRLKPGSTYFLSVKVRLERKNLPLFFQYLIPFWQLRDEETDWYYVEFRY